MSRARNRLGAVLPTRLGVRGPSEGERERGRPADPGELGATAGQVGLAWLLHRAANVLLIPGTRDPDHLAENVAAGGLSLSDEMFALLDEASAVHAEAD